MTKLGPGDLLRKITNSSSSGHPSEALLNLNERKQFPLFQRETLTTVDMNARSQSLTALSHRMIRSVVDVTPSRARSTRSA